MQHIRGVHTIDLEICHDARGDLVALDERSNLPFPLRRVFYMKIDDPKITRANHATSSDLLITVVSGAATIDLDNGEERCALRLASPGYGVWTVPGIYIRLRDFAADTVLLVCASVQFSDTRYFPTPQPDLIGSYALV